jgi:hypothetical protein
MSRRSLLFTITEPAAHTEEEMPGEADLHPDARALLLNTVAPGALQTRRVRARTREPITLCELSEIGIQPAAGPVYRLYQP